MAQVGMSLFQNCGFFWNTECIFDGGSYDGGKILGKNWTAMLAVLIFPGSTEAILWQYYSRETYISTER